MSIEFPTLASAIAAYQDTPESHARLWHAFFAAVQATPYLKAHRDYVETGKFGYGDRPFHWLWKLLIDACPSELKMLEIGVFQGQTISLAALVARETGKSAKIVGVTPLNTAGDQYATHPDINYEYRIRQIHLDHGVGRPDIMCGYSFDPRIQLLAREDGPYDIVYIDGCHDYHVVVDDIYHYAPLVRPGGYLVIDDAANYLQIPDGLIPSNWRGLEDVSRAVRETLEADPRFEHVLAIGHNRVFLRKP